MRMILRPGSQEIYRAAFAVLCLAAVNCLASPTGYVLSNNIRFGVFDVGTGMFEQIGPDLPESTEGLAAGPGGLFFSIAFSGRLYSVDPATGTAILIGPTGLDDCSTDVSPCGPTSDLTSGSLNGQIYATDFQNNLYSVSPVTGAATLIGATGMPAVPFVPGTVNLDGTLNVYDQSLFGSGGQLYATYSVFVLNPATNTVTRTVVKDSLYRINPMTGVATLVAPLTGPNPDLAVNGVFNGNGTLYGFDNLSQNVVTLDLRTGGVIFTGVSELSAGIVRGAQATPEPGSAVLMVIGASLLLLGRTRGTHR